MYSILKRLGTRNKKLSNSKATLFPAETFKQDLNKVQDHGDENQQAEKTQVGRIIRSNAKTFEEGRQAAKHLKVTEC